MKSWISKDGFRYTELSEDEVIQYIRDNGSNTFDLHECHIVAFMDRPSAEFVVEDEELSTDTNLPLTDDFLDWLAQRTNEPVFGAILHFESFYDPDEPEFATSTVLLFASEKDERRFRDAFGIKRSHKTVF